MRLHPTQSFTHKTIRSLNIPHFPQLTDRERSPPFSHHLTTRAAYRVTKTG